MIIVRLNGGLGNQMFQYAAGRALSIKNKDVFKLDASGYTDPRLLFADVQRKFLLQNFNIKSSVASPEEIKALKNPYGIFSKLYRLIRKKVFRKFYRDYHPEIFSWKGDIYLDGFFQTEKYFEDIRDIIREDFELITPLGEVAKELQSDILSAAGSISLHIRRTDYITDQKTKAYHIACPISYYENAFKLLANQIQNPRVFLFSDDIEWVKENLKLPANMTAISRPEITDYEELYLMSLCQHNIIANSSFSWWSAWLNQNPDKKVIVPIQWVSNPNDYPNIIPPTWTRI